MKSEQYNSHVRDLLYALITSACSNWKNSRYLHLMYHGKKGVQQYDNIIQKIECIKSKNVEDLKEDELYFLLSNLNGGVHYHGQYINRHLFAERLYFKLHKVRSGVFNKNPLIHRLTNLKWLWLYVGGIKDLNTCKD